MGIVSLCSQVARMFVKSGWIFVSVEASNLSVMSWSCVSVAAELPLVPPSEQRISSTSLLVTDQLELKYRGAPGRSVLLICLPTLFFHSAVCILPPLYTL